MSERKGIIRLGIIVVDNEDEYGCWNDEETRFGIAASSMIRAVSCSDDVEVHLISCLHRPVSSSGYWEKLGVTVHNVEVGNLGWKFFYIGCVRAVRGLTRELSLDIIHGHGTERYCAISAAFSGLPSAVTVHGIMANIAKIRSARIGSFYWVAKLIENVALKRVDGVVCISEYVKSQLSKRCKKTWVIANALPAIYFTKPTSKSKLGVVRFICVGRVEKNKQTLKVIEVVQDLRRRGHYVCIDFYTGSKGSTEYEKKLNEILDADPTLGVIHYGMRQSDLVRAYDEAHALIHLSEEETFGMVVAEALARNCYVFCTDSGGVLDVISGVESAYVVNVGSESDLTDEIEQWISTGHPEADTFELIKNRYSEGFLRDAHGDLYRKLLGNA